MRQRQKTATLPDKNKMEFPSSNDRDEERISLFDMSSMRIFLLCLTVRIINSLLVQTYFNPDEHWQALEVAHHIVFGYGHLTWEWKTGIRGYLHPLLFALLYKVLALLHLDTPWLMMKAPRMFQSIFAAIGDLYLYKFSDMLFGNQVARWTDQLRRWPFCCGGLFSQLANWFLFFSYTRTLSNSLETVLTVVSLYYWPCMRVNYGKVPSTSRKLALTIAALACAIRPTSAITWTYVGLRELYMTSDKLKFVFLEVAPIGILMFAVAFLFDCMIYGSWVLVPYNFLKFNFLSSGGDYYGTHRWHWYFTQGFPAMLFSFLPFSVAGFMYSKQWKIGGLIGWVLGVYSLLGHKEFRFVLHVLPIALMFAGYLLAAMKTPDFPIHKSQAGSNTKWKMQLAIFFLLATNIPMALYMSLVHQRGSEDVMLFLSREASKGEVSHVLFLMPCHATPYYSALHHNLPMRFLDCTPSGESGTPDESDLFMMDPSGFASAFAKNWSLPSHIVLFNSEEKLLKDFLVSHSFAEVKRFFHAHFKVDRDLQASVVVYAFMGW